MLPEQGTAADLAARLAQLEGCAPAQVTLVFRGAKLAPTRSLSELEGQPPTVVYFLLHFCFGLAD